MVRVSIQQRKGEGVRVTCLYLAVLAAAVLVKASNSWGGELAVQGVAPLHLGTKKTICELLWILST